MHGVTAVGRLLQEAEAAAAARPTPELVRAAAPGDLEETDREADGGDGGDGDDGVREPHGAERRLDDGQARAAAAAAQVAPAWPPITTAASSSGSSWRSSARSCARASSGWASAPQETGERLATASSASSRREEWDELELRLAQLEHRLRLLESRAEALDAAAPAREDVLEVGAASSRGARTKSRSPGSMIVLPRGGIDSSPRARRPRSARCAAAPARGRPRLRSRGRPRPRSRSARASPARRPRAARRTTAGPGEHESEPPRHALERRPLHERRDDDDEEDAR